jgi:tetratricopeptide (TPR) repeat protein
MGRAWVVFLSWLLAACASTPQVLPDRQSLFEDHYFAPQSIDERPEVFTVSAKMKAYLAAEVSHRLGWHEKAVRLAQLLRGEGELKLVYDAGQTRTAAQAFADRAGNCLSLVIMTGALARELDLGVRYYRVVVPDVWSRDGDLLLANQHVNLSIENQAIHRRPGDENFSLTVDFLPPEELRGQIRSEIGENTIVAMFLNNRAAEHLAAGRREEAYWSARAAVLADPAYLPAYNTLGVVYLRERRLVAAERAFDLARALEPENPQVLSNLEHVYRSQERLAAADRLAEQLRHLEPVPPYHYFLAAMSAVRQGDYPAAGKLLERELRREPYNHEFLFALALVKFNLGDLRESRRYLALARDNSTTLRSREIYQAKLDRLQMAQRR